MLFVGLNELAVIVENQRLRQKLELLFFFRLGLANFLANNLFLPLLQTFYFFLFFLSH